MKLRVTPIGSNVKLFNISILNRARTFYFKSIAEIAIEKLQEPTATWNHKVPMTYRVGSNYVDIIIQDDIYRWLNDGTSVRYATMDSDYRRKTTVGSFKSSTGRGGVAYVNRRVKRDGIEPANWTGLTAEYLSSNRKLAFSFGKLILRKVINI